MLPACSSMGSEGGRAGRDASEAHKGARGMSASGSFNFQTTFRRILKSNSNQLSVLNWSTKERRLRIEKPWKLWKWFGEGSHYLLLFLQLYGQSRLWNLAWWRPDHTAKDASKRGKTGWKYMHGTVNYLHSRSGQIYFQWSKPYRENVIATVC